MCGIAGYYCRQPQPGFDVFLKNAASVLSKRGPDLQQTSIFSDNAGFAHARLSIIDTSVVASQPMTDSTGRYTIIFNGEIFNYRELKNQFLQNVHFTSTGDTEVLLNLYKLLGKDCLQHLNGFFSFAIYDNESSDIFLARDRYGIKPMLIYKDEQMTLFASELKALLQFPIKKEVDYNTLALYLQLNYVPGDFSMLKGVKKLHPGHYAVIDKNGGLNISRYYTVPYESGKIVEAPAGGYEKATSTLKKLVYESVQRRLVSDVPLGAFLSGGIDSSIVTACAAKEVKQLNTFSIGYKDEPFFDETEYANLVAKKFKTEHTVFSISNDEMYANIFNILDYIDEPFADSSAIAVYVLCQQTRKKVTVALSGDGGDELFAGYNKHKAELQVRHGSMLNAFVKYGQPVFSWLPQSRHSRTGNIFRQLNRFAEGLNLSAAGRYWRWCSFLPEAEALGLLRNNKDVSISELNDRKSFVTDLVKERGDLNDVLLADVNLVLPNDMLTKVDLMSMANSLEVRVPLLDYTVVNYAFSLPVSYKINGGTGKRILKDAFKDELPHELFTRGKKGFEVPLLKWMRTGLRSLIENDLLEKDFIISQGIFNPGKIEDLKKQLMSTNPGDVHATIWALLVFQYWFKKYLSANA